MKGIGPSKKLLLSRAPSNEHFEKQCIWVKDYKTRDKNRYSDNTVADYLNLRDRLTLQGLVHVIYCIQRICILFKAEHERMSMSLSLKSGMKDKDNSLNDWRFRSSEGIGLSYLLWAMSKYSDKIWSKSQSYSKSKQENSEN